MSATRGVLRLAAWFAVNGGRRWVSLIALSVAVTLSLIVGVGSTRNSLGNALATSSLVAMAWGMYAWWPLIWLMQEQASSERLQLLPGLRRSLRGVLIGAWLVLSLPAAAGLSLVGGSVLGWWCGIAFGLLYFGWALVQPWLMLAFLVWFLMPRHWRPEPGFDPFSLSATATACLAIGVLVFGVISIHLWVGKPGLRAMRAYQRQRANWEVFLGRIGKPTSSALGVRSVKGRFDTFRLLRMPLPRPHDPWERKLMFGLAIRPSIGVGGGLLAVALALWVWFYLTDFPVGLRQMAVLWLAIAVTGGFTSVVQMRLCQTSGEQTLCRLVPGAPSAGEVNRRWTRALLRRFAIVWMISIGAAASVIAVTQALDELFSWVIAAGAAAITPLPLLFRPAYSASPVVVLAGDILLIFVGTGLAWFAVRGAGDTVAWMPLGTAVTLAVIVTALRVRVLNRAIPIFPVARLQTSEA